MKKLYALVLSFKCIYLGLLLKYFYSSFVGALTFKVLETPGHSPGSVSFLCGEALFTGDTLFMGSCGRTDLPGGDMRTLLASLRKLAMLPGDYEVYPGHMGTTTMRLERATNYYVRYAMGEE